MVMKSEIVEIGRLIKFCILGISLVLKPLTGHKSGLLVDREKPSLSAKRDHSVSVSQAP
jgi:hypothetical protein